MQKKLLTIFICFVTIPIGIVYFVFNYFFNNEMERNLKNLYSANIDNAAGIAERYFNESLELSMYPLIEPNLNLFYTADSQSEEFLQIFDNANNILSSSPYIFGGIRNITLLRKDNISLTSGTNYSYNSSISDHDRLMADSLNGKTYWDVRTVKGGFAIYITRLIKSKSNLSQELGYIKTSTSVQELINTLRMSSLEKNSSYIILTDDSLPILSTNIDRSYLEVLKSQDWNTLNSLSNAQSSTIKTGNYFISAKQIDQTPFLMCSVIQSNLMTKYSAAGRIFGPVAVLTLVFFILLAVIFSKHIARPMVELGNKMAALSTGDFTVRAHVKGNDEISALTEQFNLMSERLDYLYNQVYLTEIELNKAQLTALQSQISPHFLYNTIDTIYWMSEMGNTKAVSKIASNMSQLFHLTLTPDNQNQILLEKELQHLNCYIEIQKIRHGDSVRFTLEYEDQLNHYFVLKLLLQPLVENALIHGLKDREQEEILIRIYSQNNLLFYEVKNNGTPVNISYLNDLLSSPDEKTHGFAIRNIDKRLKLQYGNNFGLRYGLDGEYSYFKICQPLLTDYSKLTAKDSLSN